MIFGSTTNCQHQFHWIQEVTVGLITCSDTENTNLLSRSALNVINHILRKLLMQKCHQLLNLLNRRTLSWHFHYLCLRRICKKTKNISTKIEPFQMTIEDIPQMCFGFIWVKWGEPLQFGNLNLFPMLQSHSTNGLFSIK